jgi:hypothetical protein
MIAKYTLRTDLRTESALARRAQTAAALEDMRVVVHQYYSPGFCSVRPDGSGEAWSGGAGRVRSFPPDTFRAELRPVPGARARYHDQLGGLPYRVITEVDALTGCLLGPVSGGYAYLVDVVDREPPGTYAAWGVLAAS